MSISVKKWLEDGRSELVFRKEPALQKVFTKFNTGVPSSAF